MRLLLATFCVLVSFSAFALDFPPSQRQLVAVNPITNKVYIANETANSVTVLNGVTNEASAIPVGTRPQFIVVNPLTNLVYVNNGSDGSITVIDGSSDTNLTPTPLAVGSQGPMAINTETNVIYIVRMTSSATDEVTFLNGTNNQWYTIATESFQPTALTINPVTNKLYVAEYATGDVRVTTGVYDNTQLHPTTVSIPAFSHPFAIAANSATNKVYVITEDSGGPIGIINGADNTATFPLPTTGHGVGPKALAVNPVTNKIYAAFSNEVIVIDGSTNAYTYIPVNTGTGAASIAINHATNTVYVSNDSGTLTVINGATNATSTLTVAAGTISLGTNPITNEVYAAGGMVDIVSGVAGTPTSPQPSTTITPLPSNTGSASGSITLNASNSSANPLPVRGVFFQLDSLEGAWMPATGTGPYSAAFSGLSAGSHTIHAFAVEGHVVSTDTGQQSNPLLGGLASYTFMVEGLLKARLTDLNGDGRSDLLYRNFETGQLYRLLMNGFTVTSAGFAYTEPNLAWRVVADADFNGDGVTDLLWRNDSTGQVFMQLFNSSGLPASGAFVWTEPNAAWQIVATPDFDGDGKADLLWWNSVTGQAYAMQVDGTTIVAEGNFYTEPNTQWSIAAVGDFAGSGKRNQLLWRNASTGQVWLMTVTFSGGTFAQTGQMIYTAANTSWKIVAAADFNGDGMDDILYRNDSTGQVYMLLMNGPAIASEGMVYEEPNTAWKIVSVGDYDGNGRSDLLWRNDSTGAVYMMLMNGLAIASQAMVYNEPNTSWHLLGPWEYAQ